MKARLPAGYGGGGAANMQQMIRQAQKMQEAMAEKQAELDEKEYTTTAGGGVVQVTISGKKEGYTWRRKNGSRVWTRCGASAWC